jgi:hypothetical protein
MGRHPGAGDRTVNAFITGDDEDGDAARREHVERRSHLTPDSRLLPPNPPASRNPSGTYESALRPAEPRDCPQRTRGRRVMTPFRPFGTRFRRTRTCRQGTGTEDRVPRTSCRPDGTHIRDAGTQ